MMEFGYQRSRYTDVLHWGTRGFAILLGGQDYE